MKFSFSVLEYLGKVADGVLVLLSVIYEEEYFEATFFYNLSTNILTVSEELELKIGGSIIHHKDYEDIIKVVKSKVVPFNEIYNRLDNINLERWLKTT